MDKTYMDKTYYDATGVLVLDRITPVIDALFGNFSLNESHTCAGKTYIARLSYLHDPLWEDVRESLINLVATFDLLASEDELSIKDVLAMLAEHFGADQDTELKNLIERHSFEDSDPADLAALFLIATRFDDGHNLVAISFEGCWHCHRPRLFGFGGESMFISREFTHHVDSSYGHQLGEAIRPSLLAHDFDAVAARLASEIAHLLQGIGDDSAREAVRLILARRLQEGTESASGA